MLKGGSTTSTPVLGLFQEPFRCRWALNSTTWELNDHEKHYFLSLIPPGERTACTSFDRPEDQKRALASRILQRLLGSLVFNVPLPSVEVSRATRGKPFFPDIPSSTRSRSRVEFNVSHEGDWVVLVAEECCRCGVDVVGPELLNFSLQQTLVQRIQQLHGCFSKAELCSKGNDVHQCGMTVVSNTFIVVQLEQVHKLQGSATVEDRYVRILWCLKESLLKATGSGEDDPMKFFPATVVVGGVECSRLVVAFSSLPQDHIISVALVPDDEYTGSADTPADADHQEQRRPTYKDAAVPFHTISGQQLVQYVHCAMSSSCKGRLPGA